MNRKNWTNTHTKIEPNTSNQMIQNTNETIEPILEIKFNQLRANKMELQGRMWLHLTLISKVTSKIYQYIYWLPPLGEIQLSKYQFQLWIICQTKTTLWWKISCCSQQLEGWKSSRQVVHIWATISSLNLANRMLPCIDRDMVIVTSSSVVRKVIEKWVLVFWRNTDEKIGMNP